MNTNQKTLAAIAVISGLLLLALVFSPSIPSGTSFSASDELEKPVSPGMAPRLTSLPFHMAFINEETCLQCHLEGRQLNMEGEIMEAPKIAHELREDCTGCHQIPNVM